MKASTWKKIKVATKLGSKKPEPVFVPFLEDIPEGLQYRITDPPEPSYKKRVVRTEESLGHDVFFDDSFGDKTVDIFPDDILAAKFTIKTPFNKKCGNNSQMAHSDCNTDKKEVTVTSMNHFEGGWPREVRTDIAESKLKYVRKLTKEEMFKYTTSQLLQTVETGLKENLIFPGLDKQYFNESDNPTPYDHSDDTADDKRVKVVAKFKDFSGRRRPVSCLSWKKSSSVIAVSHASPNSLGCHGERVKDLYLCNVHHTVAPELTLTSPGHVTTHVFNDKQCSLLATGCYDGGVSWYDVRSGPEPVATSSFSNSHTDAVFGLTWVGKLGTEFITGAGDGLAKMWDIRMFRECVQQWQFPGGVTSLAYDQTMQSKFMVATSHGNVVSCKISTKHGMNSMIGTWEKRNPIYPKYFLTVAGDNSKIWCEDIKSDSILSMTPSSSRLTSGAWSPSRMSLFFTTSAEGFLEIRDFLLSHSSPVLQIKIADYALHCIKIRDGGAILSVGAGDGTCSIVSLGSSIVNCNKSDRNAALDVLEREGRRERILENRAKAIKVAEKQASLRAKMHADGLGSENVVGNNIETAEKTFFETVRKLKIEREKKYLTILY